MRVLVTRVDRANMHLDMNVSRRDNKYEWILECNHNN